MSGGSSRAGQAQSAGRTPPGELRVGSRQAQCPDGHFARLRREARRVRASTTLWPTGYSGCSRMLSCQLGLCGLKPTILDECSHGQP